MKIAVVSQFSTTLRVSKQAVYVATRYAPAPLLTGGRPSALRAAEQTQRSSSFHAQYVLTVTHSLRPR